HAGRLFENGGGIAFDERFGLQEPVEALRARPCLEIPRIHDLDDVAVDRLPGAVEVCPAEVGAFEPDAKALDVARLVDSRRGDGYDRGSLEQIDLDRTRYGHGHGALGRFRDGEEAEGALFADDLARVGDPGGRGEAG